MTGPADDLDRIMAVMQAAFDPAYGEAWTRRQVEDALILGNCHHRLIAPNGQPPAPGEAACGFFLSRTGFEEEELLLLAVIPSARGQGLGRKLLDRFAADAKTRAAQQLFLEMRRDNPAGALYRSFGFVAVGERLNYYKTPDGSRLDAVTFSYQLK